MPTDFHKQLLESTRGRIIALLRRGSSTAADIASELELSPSAVRVQLTRMERDGLVRRAGFERRTTRPSRRFELTAAVEALLSRAYVPLLTHIVGAFVSRYGPTDVDALLRHAGRALAEDYKGALRVERSLHARVRSASALLNEEFGALTNVERADGRFIIRGYGCPLAAITGKHRFVCLAVESLLAELIGERVTQCCSRQEPPQCCFEVDGSDTVRRRPIDSR